MVYKPRPGYSPFPPPHSPVLQGGTNDRLPVSLSGAGFSFSASFLIRYGRISDQAQSVLEAAARRALCSIRSAQSGRQPPNSYLAQFPLLLLLLFYLLSSFLVLFHLLTSFLLVLCFFFPFLHIFRQLQFVLPSRRIPCARAKTRQCGISSNFDYYRKQCSDGLFPKTQYEFEPSPMCLIYQISTRLSLYAHVLATASQEYFSFNESNSLDSGDKWM